MNEDIILEIEDSLIPCKRSILIENSEYFSAMFSGHFLESQKNTVKIEGIDSKSMNIILMLLWDHTYMIKEEDLLSVLEASLMLQFPKIKKVCEDQIMELLKPSNCLKVWKTIDQQISPLDLKAKCLALEEFSEVSQTESIFELNLDEICIYLGHTNLRAENELAVFQTCMNWWYENSKSYEALKPADVILRLLHCLDFKNVSKENLNEMKTYPDICDNEEITSLLNCISAVKENCDLAEFPKEHQEYALKLANNSRSRMVSELPCIILEPFSQILQENKMLFKQADISKDGQNSIIFRDGFGRKRKYDTVTSEKGKTSFISNDLNRMLGLLYDANTKCFREFFEIPESKCKGLRGFEILTYKEFILLFGGEVSLGNGNWNTNLWMFNSFRERWERRSVLPHYRRHFETCIVGNCVYLVGGIGRFRVVQDNLFYYDLKHDTWSSTIPLPCSSRQVKCCSYKDDIFILSLANERGYIFDKKRQQFKAVPLSFDEKYTLDVYQIFFWKEDFYIVGNYIYKFQFKDDKLILVHSQPLMDNNVKICKAVICNDTVYSFYTSTLTGNFILCTMDLETLSTKTDFGNFTLDLRTIGISDKEILRHCSGFCPISRVCTFHHYESVKDNILVNDFK